MARMILQLILLVTLCGVILGAPYPDGTDHKHDDAADHHHDHDHGHDHGSHLQASDQNARKSEGHAQDLKSGSQLNTGSYEKYSGAPGPILLRGEPVQTHPEHTQTSATLDDSTHNRKLKREATQDSKSVSTSVLSTLGGTPKSRRDTTQQLKSVSPLLIDALGGHHLNRRDATHQQSNLDSLSLETLLGGTQKRDTTQQQSELAHPPVLVALGGTQKIRRDTTQQSTLDPLSLSTLLGAGTKKRDTTQQQSKQGPPPVEAKELSKQTAATLTDPQKPKRDTAKKEEHVGGSSSPRPLTQPKENVRSTQAPKHKRETTEDKPKLLGGPLDSTRTEVHTNVDGKPAVLALPPRPGPPPAHV